MMTMQVQGFNIHQEIKQGLAYLNLHTPLLISCDVRSTEFSLTWWFWRILGHRNRLNSVYRSTRVIWE